MLQHAGESTLTRRGRHGGLPLLRRKMANILPHSPRDFRIPLWSEAVNELIEAGDPRTKVVGKRRPPIESAADRAAALDQLQRQMGRLWGSLPFHKGVYRFKTWEQFESWKTNLMMRNSPARR